jgi:hypothetical protein
MKTMTESESSALAATSSGAFIPEHVLRHKLGLPDATPLTRSAIIEQLTGAGFPCDLCPFVAYVETNLAPHKRERHEPQVEAPEKSTGFGAGHGRPSGSSLTRVE